MEVTQSIQNLRNTVELVADKTTYVRVFGNVAADRRADAVQVTLRGYQDSTELPGSPLYSVHGPRPLIPGVDWNRANADAGWLFQLPPGWIGAGTLTLVAEIDPRGIYDDPDPSNDGLVTHVTFQQKAPLCLVFAPVRTEAGKGSAENSTFRPMVDLAERLMPVPDIRVYFQPTPVEELEVCWKWGFIPYPCYGPYELWQDSWLGDWASDGSMVLTSLAARRAVSDLPCASVGGRTHFVGMVHQNSRTDGTDGLGRYDSHVVWVKFSAPGGSPSPDFPWNWPISGSVLPHELGHNIERYHVDCGNPDDLDSGYPYTDANGKECILDDGPLDDYATHFGFDVNTLQPIRPNFPSLSDFMSYSGKTWVSDYTWQAFFNKFPAGYGMAQMTSLVPQSVEQINLAAGDTVVLISGLVATSGSEGHLDYAWAYPTNSVSSQVLQQLQALAVPVAPTDPTAPASSYLVRLRDANDMVIVDHAFTPEIIADNPSPVEQAGFVLTFPAPAVPVAEIELLVSGVVIDSLQPGGGIPDIQILQPVGGETFADAMTIVWQAADPDVDDRLLFTIQYSPDLGQTWHTVVNDWPGLPDSDTFTLTLDSLLGISGSSTGALVRVAASDGYNTALATSNAFVVADQPPRPYIISPLADQLFQAGDAVLLRGGADDTEDGSVSAASLTWDVTGQSPVNGDEVFLAGLAPGVYDVALTAEDTGGLAATAQTTLTVSPLFIPQRTTAPEMNGFCDDAAYANGATVALKPYPDGNQGVVHLLRTADYLWACFSGLNRGSASMMERPMNSAGLLIDANYSREHALQAGDLWIFVQEDGTPTVWNGPTWGVGSSADGLLSRVTANDNAWNAELRIDADLLGGWNHAAGLELLHVWVPESNGSHYPWPYKANSIYPDSWATTALGQWPLITELVPNEAVKGDGAAVLGIVGENFQSGAVVLWNGAPKAATVFGPALIGFQVDESDLAQAGAVEVRVRNPGLDATPSNALTFLVKNPVPEITLIDPDSAVAGGLGVLVGLQGEHFDPDAVVLWNGEARPTVVLSSTVAGFVIGEADRVLEREVGVVVHNPEPGGGVSNVVTFTITALPNQAPDAPFAPDPAHQATDVPTDQMLGWQGTDPDGQPLRYDVAFGDTNPPLVVATGLTVAGYDPGGLSTATTYYWRITASDGLSTTTGPVWAFATAAVAAPNRAPNVPNMPNPSDGLTGVPVDQSLRWKGGDPDGDPVTYTLALGTSSPPPVVATDLTERLYDPPTLDMAATYYWAVTATDGISNTAGLVWSFATMPANRAPYTPSKPSPSDGDYDVSLNPLLRWQGGDPDSDAVTYRVYMGTSLPLSLVASDLTDSQYTPLTLTAGTRHYWSIRASDGLSTTTGPVWSFTTVSANRPPYEPYAPTPAHGATGVPVDQALTWRASDPDRDRLTYTVALGTRNPPPVVAENLTTASYTPSRPLQTDATYYWIVTASDGLTETVGPTWSFKTASLNQAPAAPYFPYPDDQASGVPLDSLLSWSGYDPDKDPLTYDVYFGDSDPPPLVSESLTTTVYTPGVLDEGLTYYWAIHASDGVSVTVGSTWRFQTTGFNFVYLPLVLRNN